MYLIFWLTSGTALPSLHEIYLRHCRATKIIKDQERINARGLTGHVPRALDTKGDPAIYHSLQVRRDGTRMVN